MKNKSLPLVGLVLLLIWFSCFHPANLGGKTSYIIVSGNSMEPTFYTGDLVILHKADDYRAGEVVAYRVGSQNVIHRIVGQTDGKYTLRGDNKDSVDPWTPTYEEILGKEWLHIPKAGKILQYLRSPFGLAIVGFIGIFIIFNEPINKPVKQRKGIRMGNNGQNNASLLVEAVRSTVAHGRKRARINYEQIKNIAAIIFVFFVVGFASLGYLGYLGFSAPLERSIKVDALVYQHVAEFDYQVNTQVSTLYPQGVVKPPISGPGIDEEITTNTMVFTQLAKSIDIDFTYRLQHDDLAEINGEVKPVVQLWQYENLVITEPLSTVVNFTGDVVSTRINLDLKQLEKLISSIGEETGMGYSSYKLLVVPNVHLTGFLGEVEIDEEFAPSLTINYDPDQISIVNDLALIEEKSIQDETTKPNTVSFFGMIVPVQQARMWGLIGGSLSLVIIGLASSVLFLGWGLPESERIRIRHGSMIIDVAKTRLCDNPAVRVAKITDLVKVAERTGSVICHVQQSDDAHFYFVPDTQVVYTYAIGSIQQEGKAECDDS